MVTSVQGMLEERESAAPSDPLEQITGIRTGNIQPPDDATMRRLLPDDYPTPLPISIVYPQARVLSSRARCFIEFLLAELRVSA